MHTHLSRLLIILYIILSVFNSNTQAKENTFILKGVVLTTKNEPLYNAHISIPALQRGTISNQHGDYIFTNLPSGKYKVVVSYIGYESIIRTIDFHGDFNVVVNFKLSPKPIKTEAIVVTGNPNAVNPLESPQDISVLSGREKMEKEGASLGETLSSMPGVYNLSAGSVAGKPVVRGHSSERVLILSDGISQEYQQYGERHSPNVESNNYDRIEVIKGAASLLYGSDAIGGAINLIPHPFHFTEKNKFIYGGSLSGGYISNSNQFYSALNLNGSTEKFSIKGNLVRRKADNFHTPDVAPFTETLQNGDPKFTSEIPNTNFEQLNGFLGVGYLSPWGIISIDYKRFDNSNNFLLPDGKGIGVRLRNQIVSVKGNIPTNNFIFKPKFDWQNNRREATNPGNNYSTLPDSSIVDLLLDVYTARLEIEHFNYFKLIGNIGFEIKHYNHENIGNVPLQPTGKFTNYAMFFFEEWKSGNLSLNFGSRFDYRNQVFYGTTTNPLLTVDDQRSYSSIAASVGAAYQITDNFTSVINVSRGFRTPSFFNLYVYGNHGGVFAFQIGNPDLENEISLDFSTSLRYVSNTISMEATLFHNTISNYIYLYNAPDHPLAPQNATFVFAHDQADASLTGIDLSGKIAITNWMLFDGSYSMINSRFASGSWEGDGLPLMPPNRLLVGFKFLLPEFSYLKNTNISVNSRFVSAKNAAGIYEPFGQFDDGIGPNIPFGTASTESYYVIDLASNFDLKISDFEMNLNISVANLLNNDYRDFLDTYKGYSLAPGRSYNIKIDVPFTH